MSDAYLPTLPAPLQTHRNAGKNMTLNIKTEQKGGKEGKEEE